MDVAKLTKENEAELENKVLKVLGKEGVVVAPTDTVYGFICSAQSAKAVKKIFDIKERGEGKPLGIFVMDMKTAKEYAEISRDKEEFLRKVWPGKITAVLKGRVSFPAGVGLNNTIGIRVPNYPFLLNLMEALGGPLVQTSVNISGEPPLKNVEEMIKIFESKQFKPDLIIDAGTLSLSDPSTVIDLTGKVEKVLRKGAL